LAVALLALFCLPLFLIKYVDQEVLEWTQTTYGGGDDYELYETADLSDLNDYYDCLGYANRPFEGPSYSYIDTVPAYKEGSLTVSYLDPNATFYSALDISGDFNYRLAYVFPFSYSPDYFVNNDIRKITFTFTRTDSALVGDKKDELRVMFRENSTSEYAAEMTLYSHYERNNETEKQYVDHSIYVTLSDLLQAQALNLEYLSLHAWLDENSNGVEVIHVKVQLYKVITTSVLVNSGLVKNQYERLGCLYALVGFVACVAGLHGIGIVDLRNIFKRLRRAWVYCVRFGGWLRQKYRFGRAWSRRRRRRSYRGRRYYENNGRTW